MKRIILLSFAALCLIALSACVKNEGLGEAVTAQSTVSVAGEPSSSTSGSIIAESSNAVSDKDIESILDDLSVQLEEALNGTGNLEDIDDSDLDVNSID